jgi:hypothetical protein
MTGPRRVFRGRLGPLVAYPIAVAVVALLVVIARGLPTEGGLSFAAVDRVALVLIGLAVAWFLHRLAAVRIVADDAGVTVHNVLRRRRVDWAEIVAVRFGPDDPWVYLDLADGTTLAAMGIQSADGDRARAAAAELAALVAARSQTPRDD